MSLAFLVDLETGDIRRLAWDERMFYMGLRVFSADGKFTLAPTLDEEQGMQLWLVRADSGEVRLLAEGTGVSGALSPDGRWAVAGTIERTDDHLTADLTLMETEGEGTRPLGEGVWPIWVPP
jgi:hypothetical protein